MNCAFSNAPGTVDLSVQMNGAAEVPSSTKACSDECQNDRVSNGKVRIHPILELIAKVTNNGSPTMDLSVMQVAHNLELTYKIITQEAIKRADVAKYKRRAEIRRENSDATKGYSKLFRQLRANQAPPCSLLKIDGTLTGDMGKIHEEFATKWETVFNRLRNTPPNYDEFLRDYGQYVYGTEAGDLLPNAK